MKSHPRIRKTIKWGGAAMTMLLAVLRLGSVWWRVELSERNGEWEVCTINGGFAAELRQSLEAVDPPQRWQPPEWSVTEQPDNQTTWRGNTYIRQETRIVYIPMWPLLLCAAVTTAVAWRRDTLARRRARLNRCAQCSYDRAGLAANALCPECGRR